MVVFLLLVLVCFIVVRILCVLLMVFLEGVKIWFVSVICFGWIVYLLIMFSVVECIVCVM